MTHLTLLKDGPIIVTADEIILNTDGQELAPVKKVALCRCGQSKTKPFCDGAHVQDEKGLPEGAFQAISYK